MTILPLEVRAAQRASDSPGRSRTFRASWAFSEEGAHMFLVQDVVHLYPWPIFLFEAMDCTRVQRPNPTSEGLGDAATSIPLQQAAAAKCSDGGLRQPE
jgi:hypothetical protein